MSCPPVTLGTLLLDGATPDANGTLWTPTRLDGWWDSTGMRSATAEAQPVGEVVTVGRENGRALSLEVTATSDEPNSTPLGETQVFLAQETMKGAARAVLLPVLMLVNDPVLAGQAYVRRVGPIKFAINGALVSAHFMVPLLAPDPRRYAQTLDTDSLVMTAGVGSLDQNVVTAGVVDTPFVVTFRGPCTNPKLLSHSLGVDAAHRPFLQWVGALADNSDHVVIDTAAGTVLHNGTDASSGLATGSQMFDLIPGTNALTVSRTVTTGSSTTTVARRDAFD